MPEIREGYILTEQECKEKGGHKYSNDWFIFEGQGDYIRTCIYCGQNQKGYTSPTVWEDEES